MTEDSARGYLRLMSILGHELRTPLTVIRGAATLVLQAHDQLPPERVDEMLKLIDDNSGTMAERIEDMLSLSQLDAGDLILNVETVALSEIVGPAVESARRLGLARVEALDSAGDLTVAADRERAVQALRVLLANAAKDAGRSASVTVRINRGDGRVLVEGLHTSGERHRAKQRQPASAGELTSASELGLYLARGLARAMGGDAGQELEGGLNRVWITLNLRG